jgi:hypothetical protein
MSRKPKGRLTTGGRMTTLPRSVDGYVVHIDVVHTNVARMDVVHSYELTA